MLGTVDYMAPEQVEGGPVGAPTDVYALGCVVYQCITGKPPFLGGEMAVLAAHLGEQPPELRGDARVERISAVIGRALAKRPEDRQTSAGEFASDLREAIGPAAPVAGRTVQHIHAEGGGDRRWWLLAAAVAMALIAAIAGVVWFSSTGSSHSAAGGAVLGSQALGTRRTMLAAAGGGVYVAQITGSNLTGVLESYGPVPGQPLATTPLVSLPFGLAVGDNRAWVLTVSGRRAANAQLLAAPVSNEPPREPGLPLPGRNACVQFPAAECNPVFGAGSVWAASGSKLYRVSPVTLRITKRIAIGSPVTALAFGGGAAWVVSSDGVERIDALTGSVEPVESSLLSPDLRPARVVFVENRLWVLCYASDRAARNVLARIDTGLPEPTVTAIVKYPEASALATSGSDLWVGTSIAPSTVRELDPQTGRTAGDPIALKAAVTGLARSGSRLLAITYDEGTSLRRLVWVGVTH
jgi:hypothetical protein